MRLYKMELYKIISRKIFIVGAVCTLAIILIWFWAEVADERATVDGITYTGYRAVQVNRQITEEFKGVLTDEKAEEIVEKYGFPQKREKGWGYFRDANFLNELVMTYLSDGYTYSEDEYKVATCVYPIADTDLGAVREFIEEEIIIAYYTGWETFMEVLPVGMMLGSILVIFGLAVVFAGEGQSKMLPLLFTAKEGKDKDIRAKIAAAFTAAVGIGAGVFVLDLLLCGIVYGFDGLDCFAGMVMGGGVYLYWPETIMPAGLYIAITVLISFFGILLLCAVTICISAFFKSSFHAVVAAAACWGAPLLFLMFFRDVYRLLFVAPIIFVWSDILFEIYDIWYILLGEAAVVSVLCTVRTYRKYEGQQVE